jgi:hypothetical protein
MKRNVLIAFVALMSVLGASGAHARSYYPATSAVYGADNVWVDQTYAGRDPDLNIRMSLRREFGGMS